MGSAPDFDLARYHWRMRVLLVFAPVQDDPRLMVQNQAIAAASSGARERDLVVIQSIGTSELHHRFHVPDADFAVVLLGKDGDEKWRRDTPATAEAIYSVIDQMPMRRSEAAR